MPALTGGEPGPLPSIGGPQGAVPAPKNHPVTQSAWRTSFSSPLRIRPAPPPQARESPSQRLGISCFRTSCWLRRPGTNDSCNWSNSKFQGRRPDRGHLDEEAPVHMAICNHRADGITLIATGAGAPIYAHCNSIQNHCNGFVVGSGPPTIIASASCRKGRPSGRPLRFPQFDLVALRIDDPGEAAEHVVVLLLKDGNSFGS